MSSKNVAFTLPCGIEIEAGVALASFTSWLTGGAAEFFVQPHTVEELGEAVEWAKAAQLPVNILGGGTNVLVSDQGVAGLTVALRKMAGAKASTRLDELGEKKLVIECLAGTSKSELLKIFLKHKLEPALFLAGLPGDVGGGIAMNAGVGEIMHPREFVEITDWVEVLRWQDVEAIETIRFSSGELHWGYRHCLGWQPGIITRVGLSWPLIEMDDVLNRVKQANRTRLSKQPLDLPSCGSVFVNPEGLKSGQLIESAGLKGRSIGGAQVSTKHANFIVNTGRATAQDIHELIRLVQQTVLAQSGVHLKTEVVYMGRWT